MNGYTTRHLIELFGISHETVKAWAREFAQYLSPTATPTAGTKRVFTENDLTIFALVSDYKRRGLNFADAHVALKTGQRGDVPNPSALDLLPPAARDMIVRLRNELESKQAELDAERNKTSKAVGQVELLKEQIAEKERRITELVEENARLKAKGE